MNTTYFGIIQLIKSSITGNPITLPADFDWKTAIKFARFHKIEALVYYGAFYSNIKIPAEYEGDFKKCILVQASFDAQQEYNITALCTEFDRRNITYLPLKGMLLKKYYPKSEMRYMSDADILVKTEEYPKIQEIMQKLGYSFKVESDHEYIWIKQQTCVELHKRLIPSYNKDYYEYYGDGWQLARLQNGRYSMSDEDFYLYLFTHLAKHYRDSGIGIKQFVDLWVFRRVKTALNKEYIEEGLKKLQLAEFHKNCIDMLNYWFDDAPETEILSHMTDFVFLSGVYGTKKTNELSTALKETLEMDNTNNLKLKFYIRKLFPPYKLMKKEYAILERLSVLLPLMWIVRIFRKLFLDKKSIKGNVQKINMLTEENIREYENSLDYVGLRFDFKEKN